MLLADDVLRRYLLGEMGSLRRYALSLAGSVHDADDLVQATLERALNSGLPVEAPKAWLVRVCRNLWIDELRKRQIRNHNSYVEEGEGISEVLDASEQRGAELEPRATLSAGAQTQARHASDVLTKRRRINIYAQLTKTTHNVFSRMRFLLV